MINREYVDNQFMSHFKPKNDIPKCEYLVLFDIKLNIFQILKQNMKSEEVTLGFGKLQQVANYSLQK